MLAVTVEFLLHPESFAEFLEAVRAHAHNSLTREDGCHRFDVCVAEDDGPRVFLYEIYADRKAFDLHGAADYLAEFSQRTESWIVERRLSVWNVTDGTA